MRIDAGFADGQTLNAIDSEGIEFIARLPSNPQLERLFEPHRYRGPGRPSSKPREWVVETEHQASTWAVEHRVLIVVQEHPEELFRRCFFLVTNMPQHRASGEFILEHYRRRGKAEGHFGELKTVLGESLPCSTHHQKRSPDEVFARSQALLSLRVIAYQILHVLRGEVERMTGTGWSLARVRERLLKVAGRVRFHARCIQIDVERKAATYWNRLMGRLTKMQPLPG
ncbi:transposase [Halorhodospira halochloris]|uniref:transposase n=1 Tax=Halorhodospira halochloris TaxID=1052 RepID=UPI001EE83223|nr:transposase [Halorhodospira halochloris]